MSEIKVKRPIKAPNPLSIKIEKRRPEVALRAAMWWVKNATDNGDKISDEERGIIIKVISDGVAESIEKYNSCLMHVGNPKDKDDRDDILFLVYQKLGKCNKFTKNTYMNISKDAISVSSGSKNGYEKIWPKETK